MEYILQLLNGLQIGSIYALVSLGYTMVYGIAKLINFAHGDIIMVGSYTALFSIPVLNSLGLPLWLSLIPAIIICVFLGMLAEHVAYRPLRNSPRISNLITAIGVSLLLENGAMLLFGTQSKPFPGIFAFDHIQTGGLSVNMSTLVTILVTLVLTLCLQVFMKKTKFGKAMLAVSEDYGAAKLVGISVDKTIALTFAIGSALAAIGSTLYLSAYPQVFPMMGSMLGIKAFIAAVLGGIGSIPGAVLGGFMLGIAEVFTRVYISSQLGDAVVFGILVLVLLFRPAGLLGRMQREKV
ncbi:putative high-affinity branched-chain amino acid ABC transporter, permease protein LivH [Peptostreptococcaceae bacterium oral taxon 113 str. W5053]|nr:putative high-affinity branched-chain amino acid ABC transporter, permease protein LivH [Peptostreptococcaceae bacterium oral taxon 113 str. W5053]